MWHWENGRIYSQKHDKQLNRKYFKSMAFLRISFITISICKKARIMSSLFLWENVRIAKNKEKCADEESAFSKKAIRRRLHDSFMQLDGTLSPQTAQEEHFIYLSLPYLALYTSLQNLPEKNCLSAKSSVWKGGLFRFHQPRVIFTPTPLPLHAPTHLSLPLPETSLCQFVLS